MYYKLKHKPTGKYLGGEMHESILMLIDGENHEGIISIHETDIDDLYIF